MKRGVLFAGLIVLSGCAVGPKYKAPVVAPPVAYKEPAPPSFKAADGWKLAEPRDQIDRHRWWELFGNDELNKLAAQVEVSNENLKAAEARFRQARSLIRVNRAAKSPQLGVSPGVGGVRFSSNRPGFPASLTAQDSANLTIPADFSYELDLWGRIRKTVDASRDLAQASAADLQSARLSLQAELATRYFEMCAASEEQRILRSTVAAFEESLKLTTNRFEGGVAPKTDVAQAKAQLESARAALTDVEVDKAQNEHAIAVLTGQAPAALSVTAAGSPAMQPPAIPIGLPSDLLERRPDVAAMERRTAAANEQIGIAKTAFYPRVTFGAQGGFQGTSLLNWFNWPSRFWSVGPTAVLPILDGGRRKAVTEGAVAGYDAAVADYRQTVLTAFQEVEDNIAALRVLETEDIQQRAAVSAAQESLTLAMNRYQGGVDTYLQVLNAQTIELTSELRTVDIQRRRMVASVQLIRALGGGWTPADLPALASK